MNYDDFISKIEDPKDTLKDEMFKSYCKADAEAYRHPSLAYRLYVDSNGIIDWEEWGADDGGYFDFREGDYKRYYFATLCYKGFDLLNDWWYQSAGDCRDSHSEKENEEALEDAIYEAVNSDDNHVMFEHHLSAILEEYHMLEKEKLEEQRMREEETCLLEESLAAGKMA